MRLGIGLVQVVFYGQTSADQDRKFRITQSAGRLGMSTGFGNWADQLQPLHGAACPYYSKADDLQVYTKCDVDDINTAKSKLELCLADVRRWMLRWQLKINDDKTEFILFHNRQTKIPNDVTLQLGGIEIAASSTVKNLGVYFDPQLNREKHVSEIIRTCNYSLRRLSRIRRYLTEDTCKRAVHALILSKIDYCNSLLADVPVALLNKLQRLQNRAARVILRPSQPRNAVVHITPLLQKLSWLPIRQRIAFKICCLVFKCLHGRAPEYLRELVTLQSRPTRLRQPRDNTLAIPRTCRRIGASSFAVVGPTLWNQLPPALRNTTELFPFRRRLKTYLWQSQL